MERDDPRAPANAPAESSHEVAGEHGEDHAGLAESSGQVTTKQAAKSLGVSRRTVQSYVRRGELEAEVEGEGVEKTFYISIDSLNALRERRKSSGESARGIADVASRASPRFGATANTANIPGETSPDLIDVVQELQYRLGRAEAQVELTERTESTLREQLAREQERADRLEAELREVRKPPPEPRDAVVPGTEDMSGGQVSHVHHRTQERPFTEEEEPRRRSWLARFFGFE
jgi:excisionase family DNA binding protein